MVIYVLYWTNPETNDVGVEAAFHKYDDAVARKEKCEENDKEDAECNPGYIVLDYHIENVILH